MWRLATSLTRVIGLASLSLLATSVPPSARPSQPLAKPESGVPKGSAKTPAQKSDQRDRSSDPALVVSADLGLIWDKAAEVRAGEPTGRAPKGLGFAAKGCGPAPQAGLIIGPLRGRPIEWVAGLASAPAEAVGAVRLFLTADRAQAPPRV